MSGIIDAHHHLQEDDLLEEGVILSPRNVGEFEQLIKSSERFPKCYITLGIHPWEVDSIDFKIVRPQLKKYLQNDEMIGIGEVGLDRSHHHKKTIYNQITLLEEILSWSAEFPKRPFVFHCVSAHGVMKDIILKVVGPERLMSPWAILHSFNGEISLAKEYIKMGIIPSIAHLETLERLISNDPLLPFVVESDDRPISHAHDLMTQKAKLLQQSFEETHDQQSDLLKTIGFRYRQSL